MRRTAGTAKFRDFTPEHARTIPQRVQLAAHRMCRGFSRCWLQAALVSDAVWRGGNAFIINSKRFAAIRHGAQQSCTPYETAASHGTQSSCIIKTTFRNQFGERKHRNSIMRCSPFSVSIHASDPSPPSTAEYLNSTKPSALN